MLVRALKISIFNTRALCYDSSSFFLGRIEEALEKVTEVERTEPKDAVGDVYLDINSRIPRECEKDDGLRIDSNVPLFNFILDHPLYHHKSLMAPVNNHHVITLNKAHGDYVKRHYPNISSVNVLPVPGTSPLFPLPYKDREASVLFMGSFISPDRISEEVRSLRETYGSSYTEILYDFMDYWDPAALNMENALENYLKEESVSIESLGFCESFNELMNLLFPADRIKRNVLREDVLFRLSREVPLTVMGEGWEESRLKNERVRFIQGDFYGNAIQLNGKYKYVLDVNPFFGDGIHDRAGNAFAAGSLLFSNMKQGERTGPRIDREYIYYDYDDISGIVDALNHGGEENEYISARGMSYWMDNLTWDIFAKKLLKFLCK